MKKDKKGKILLIAFALVLGMFGMGFIAGNLMAKLTKGVDFAELFKVNEKTAAVVFSVIQGVIVIGGLLVSFIIYQKTKIAADKWDGEDEDSIDKIERDLSIPMFITSTVIILNTMLFSCAVYFAFDISGKYGLATTVIFLIGMGFSMTLTEKCVRLEKVLNPEKRGSAFDLKFQKKWMDSCDEAQKQNIWQAGFAAYQAGTYACFIMWFFAILVQLTLHSGLVPIIVIGVIWLTLNTAYMVTAAKLENRK